MAEFSAKAKKSPVIRAIQTAVENAWKSLYLGNRLDGRNYLLGCRPSEMRGKSQKGTELSKAVLYPFLKFVQALHNLYDDAFRTGKSLFSLGSYIKFGFIIISFEVLIVQVFHFSISDTKFNYFNLRGLNWSLQQHSLKCSSEFKVTGLDL